jgi:hypothetical protein
VEVVGRLSSGVRVGATGIGVVGRLSSGVRVGATGIQVAGRLSSGIPVGAAGIEVDVDVELLIRGIKDVGVSMTPWLLLQQVELARPLVYEQHHFPSEHLITTETSSRKAVLVL